MPDRIIVRVQDHFGVPLCPRREEQHHRVCRFGKKAFIAGKLLGGFQKQVFEGLPSRQPSQGEDFCLEAWDLFQYGLELLCAT